MAGTEAPDGQTETQVDIDRAIEEALELDFASFEEAEEAFRS